jgi:hypothetical protein
VKELIDMLTNNLGVNGAQAEGGAAVLFKVAKDKLGDAEFGKLLGGVPGLSDLLSKAPAPGGGALGGLLGMAGSMGGNAGAIAAVLSGFGKLGLTADHAKKFVPVIMQFLRTKVGADVVSRLEQTLRA